MSRLEVDIRVVVPEFVVEAAFFAPAGITVLAGPSGSGKSLTLAAIAGTVRPNRGRIRLGETLLADAEHGVHIRSQERRLGVVYQHAGLLEHRSPIDNVRLAVGGDVVAAGEMLERVGASHLRTKRTKTLSGGERQRVALARALVGSPAALLLDEPFSSLDTPTREDLRRLVRELVTERRLIALLVTHDAQDVSALADRVVEYEPGRTVAASE